MPAVEPVPFGGFVFGLRFGFARPVGGFVFERLFSFFGASTTRWSRSIRDRRAKSRRIFAGSALMIAPVIAPVVQRAFYAPLAKGSFDGPPPRA